MANFPKFLIIDDDEDDREIFQIALEETKTNSICYTAVNALVALEMLKNNAVQPDFIFLDFNMPKMSGKECLLQLKSDEKTKHISVVMFSTSSDPSDIEETMQLGALDFFSKPSQVKELTSYLSKHILNFENKTN